jgi:hypothetical protein
MSIIEKHFLNCPVISGNAEAIGETSFLAHMDGVGGQGVEPPVRALGKLTLDIGVI